MKNNYTDVVGQQFNKDNSVRRFPGNTVICHMDKCSKTYNEVLWAYKLLQTLHFNHKLAFLPPPSFHMTVFGLLLDEVRRQENWSSFLSPTLSLHNTDEFFRKVFPSIDSKQEFQMKYQGIKIVKTGIAIYLKPIDDEVALRIKVYRKKLVEVTGVRHSDHEEYQFHITLAYQTIEYSNEEKEIVLKMMEKIDQALFNSFGIFHADNPQLVFFNDMHSFLPSIERSSL